jgi:SAM-dependent methyltransferase
MKALGRAGFDAYGIEPSKPFHSRLDAKRVKLSTIEDADFEPGRFDFILFAAVLEHLYSPSRALSQALRWLKPGGIIYAYVPSSRWLIARLLNRYFALRGTNYITHLSPMHVPYHLFEFTAESFRRNGERLGYEVALSKTDVCAIPYVPRPLQPVAGKLMERTDTGMMLAVYLRHADRQPVGPT